MLPIVIGAFASLVAVGLDRVINPENDKGTSTVIVFITVILTMVVVGLIGE